MFSALRVSVTQGDETTLTRRPRGASRASRSAVFGDIESYVQNDIPFYRLIVESRAESLPMMSELARKKCGAFMRFFSG
jgi:hypothetical protein